MRIINNKNYNNLKQGKNIFSFSVSNSESKIVNLQKYDMYKAIIIVNTASN